MTIEEIWGNFFIGYCEETGRDRLRYVVTSTYRENGGPHGVRGNALDFTLRWNQDYAPIRAYNDLFAYMLTRWPYRAGIDNTHGNIHIHLDLGAVLPVGQVMPFFFKEEDSKYLHRITKEADLYGTT